MNGSLVILGIFTVSMAVASYLAYKMTIRSSPSRSAIDRGRCDDSSKNSTLEDDFRDILDYIPIEDVNRILHDYLMYDKQMADTYSFIDDQIKFISREFEALPHTAIFLGYLRDMGLRIDHWWPKIATYWKSLPRYARSEPDIASGGLTIMIRRIMRQLPRNELHVLLWLKTRCSKNFRLFASLLASPLFDHMCHQVANNKVLRQHYYWAMEAEIEATFALELFYALRSYLLQGLI